MSTDNERRSTARWESCILALCWGLVIELVLAIIGAAIGGFVYLPGPLDGWFYFYMMIFGTGGLLLGIPISLAVLIYFFRR